MSGPHPSHVTRMSDASTFDEICVNCGAHDQVPGGWGRLADPCTCPPEKRLTSEQYYERQRARTANSGRETP